MPEDRLLRWRYNIDEAEYNRILESQGGHCLFCPQTINLVIDHDHSCCKTDQICGRCIRGILCGKHNTMLGLANDDPIILDLASAYIRSAGFRMSANLTARPSIPRTPRLPRQPKRIPMTEKRVMAIFNHIGTVREIAKLFDCSIGTVSDIRSGKRYSEITGLNRR